MENEKGKSIVEIVVGVTKSRWDGAHYRAVVSSGGWRVALLNHGERFAVKGPLERHLKTDEAFVLLDGAVTLWIGAEETPVRLEPFAVYCVKAGVWHRVTTVPGTRCLVVENDDTGPANTEYANASCGVKDFTTVRQEGGLK